MYTSLKLSKTISFILLALLFLNNFQQSPISNLNESPFQSAQSMNILAQDIGDSRIFWELNFSNNVHYQLDAYLMAIGEYCYIYMQDTVVSILGESEATNRCGLYRDEFDATIYPKVTELTGNPDGIIGDIDNDPKVIILISENTATYYSQYNEIQHVYSNLCEMFYIYYNNIGIIMNIAHEFCHLIWFNYEFDEVHFILEGLAEYAIYYAGYLTPYNNLSPRTSYFLNHPEDSLIWFEAELKDYGGAYLFVFYLAERFGLDFLKALVQQEIDGALGIETTLHESGYDITFNEVFLDWITALVIDCPDIEEGQYGFSKIDFQLQNTAVIDYPLVNESQALNYYGFQAYNVANSPDSFNCEISGNPSDLLGLSIAFHDVDGWHIQQSQNNGTNQQNVSGNSIDTTYVVLSYIDTPIPAGEIDFGVGPSIITNISLIISNASSIITNVELESISNQSSETDRKGSLLFLGSFSVIAIAFAIGIFAIVNKKKSVSV